MFDESNSGGSFLFRFMLLCQIQCAMRILHITVEKIMKIIEIIKSSISFKWQRNLRPAELWITPPFAAVALWLYCKEVRFSFGFHQHETPNTQKKIPR